MCVGQNKLGSITKNKDNSTVVPTLYELLLFIILPVIKCSLNFHQVIIVCQGVSQLTVKADSAPLQAYCQP